MRRDCFPDAQPVVAVPVVAVFQMDYFPDAESVDEELRMEAEALRPLLRQALLVQQVSPKNLVRPTLRVGRA